MAVRIDNQNDEKIGDADGQGLDVVPTFTADVASAPARPDAEYVFSHLSAERVCAGTDALVCARVSNSTTNSEEAIHPFRYERSFNDEGETQYHFQRGRCLLRSCGRALGHGRPPGKSNFLSSTLVRTDVDSGLKIRRQDDA